MQPNLVTPEPGIYRGVPFETYLQWDAISNSRLNLAAKSPAHFHARVFKEASPALRLGQFVHCGVLEPLAVTMRYAVLPEWEKDSRNVTKQGEASSSKGTTFYKDQLKAFKESNPNKQLVSREEYDNLLGINKALYANERARQWLTERGESEVSIVWRDEDTDLLCKARIDLLTTAIIDLKTTMDAAQFPKAMGKYGYHRQMYFYREGYTILTGEILETRLIVVESSAPYPVRAAKVNDEALEVGGEEVRRLMRQVAECYQKNDWPAYENPNSWVLPAYYEGGDDEIEIVVNGETVSV